MCDVLNFGTAALSIVASLMVAVHTWRCGHRYEKLNRTIKQKHPDVEV